MEENTTQRTIQQNRALHLDCKIISQKLNEAGLDMRKVLKPTYNLPWTPASVKEHIFKPIMQAMYGKHSTTELDKTGGEIDQIHEVIMRELGEKFGIEWHDFPHDEEKRNQLLKALELAKKIKYPDPENFKEPTI